MPASDILGRGGGGLARVVGEGSRKLRHLNQPASDGEAFSNCWTDDLALKIDRLHERLSRKDESGESHISRAARKRPDFRHLTCDQYSEECDKVVLGSSKWVNHHSNGIAFDKLLDIKLLFDCNQTHDESGFAEDEFVRLFAPFFCQEWQDPHRVKLWFMGIDQDANGLIDWEEFSSYLMKTQHSGADAEAGARCYVSKGAEPGHLPAAAMPINRIAHNPQLGIYYTAASDGTVRTWDSTTLEERGVVHYGEGCSIHSLHYLEATKRLVVSQFDRLTFIYTCGTQRRGAGAGHRLQRVFKGENVHKGNENKVNSIMKLCEFDPDSMIMENSPGAQLFTQVRVPDGRSDQLKMQGTSAARVGRYKVDVVLMDGLNRTEPKERVGLSDASVERGLRLNVQCMDPMHSVFVDKADPFVLGAEEGYVFLYNFSLRDDPAGSAQSAIMVQHLEPGQNIRPLERWLPHTDWVTHVQAAPALQGFISSSMDGTIQVLDVTKGDTYLKMEVDQDGVLGTGGNDTGGGRGVHHFDYAPERNLLCSCGIRRDVTVWNPKARQRMCTLEHRAAMVSVKFVEKHSQLITLSEDKIIKVWDLRMFRCVQTLTDKERRMPEDKYTALGYDMANDAILCGAGVPIVWRDVDAQAKLDTGVSWHPDYEGHLSAITACSYNSRFGHLLSADDRHFYVWDLATGRRLSKWSPFEKPGGKRITAACFDSELRRLLTGADDGGVNMWSLDGRLLKSFVGLALEVSSVLHIVAHEGQSHAQAFVIAGGFGCKCAVWPDTGTSGAGNHRIPVEKQPHTLTTHNNPVHCFSFSPPNKLAIGTANGAVLVYNINNMSLMSEMRSVVGASFRRLKPRGEEDVSPSPSPTATQQPPVPSSAPGSPAPAVPTRRPSTVQTPAAARSGSQLGGKPPSAFSPLGSEIDVASTAWPQLPSELAAPVTSPRVAPATARASTSRTSSRVRDKIKSVMRLEANLDGALEFTRFRSETQMQQLTVTEALCFVPHPSESSRCSGVIVTLHGDGDALVWRLREGYFLEIAACFPASYSPGEAAYALAVDRETSSVYVGDGDAVISVFDLAHYVQHLDEERDKERKAPAARERTPDQQQQQQQQRKTRQRGGGSFRVPALGNALECGDDSPRASGRAPRKLGKPALGLGAKQAQPRSMRRDHRGSQRPGGSEAAGTPVCRRGPSGRIYHNRCRADNVCACPLVRLVRCFHLGPAGAITHLSLVPGSPVLIAACNDASISLVDRRSAQVLARFGSVSSNPSSWPTGLPEDIVFPENPMPVPSGHQQSRSNLAPCHRFTYVFPDQAQGTGMAEDALQALHWAVTERDAETSSQVSRRGSRTRQGLSSPLPPLAGVPSARGSTVNSPGLAGAASFRTSASPQRQETPANEDMHDFDREMNQQAHSVARANADRYDRYLRRYLSRAPPSQLSALELVISTQTQHRANEQVMHQLSKAQQRKRNRADVRQFDYTLLRDYKLRDIPDDLSFLPHSSPRAYGQQCMWIPPGQAQPERAGCRHCRKHRAQPATSSIADERPPMLC
eukprot:TRINITY_DN4877_c4_g1_i2.p1 TRINITY_DN4877_c4_g1~~TRINITY_DN4877_c4_g1_i2.p1  ORF type:complete len:1540 (+),score=397.03 TRINITY_DN4877_c4_g1_i2:141-4760(+)